MVFKNKNCEICGLEYSPKSSRQKYCIKCRIINRKEYHNIWRKKNKEYGKKWYHKNKDKSKQYSQKYHLNNKEKINKQKRGYMKEYGQMPSVKKKKREFSKKDYHKNIEKSRKRSNDYYHKNKDAPNFKIKRAKYRKERYQKIKNNPEYKLKRKIYLQQPELKKKRHIRRNIYETNKRKTDRNYNILIRLRTLFSIILRKYTKTGKIMSSKKYGIDYKAIIEHLKPFPKELSNYEIHHIKPFFTFNFVNKDGSTDLKEVKRAFTPENHKWLTIKEHKEIHRKMMEEEK